MSAAQYICFTLMVLVVCINLPALFARLSTEGPASYDYNAAAERVVRGMYQDVSQCHKDMSRVLDARYPDKLQEAKAALLDALEELDMEFLCCSGSHESDTACIGWGDYGPELTPRLNPLRVFSKRPPIMIQRETLMNNIQQGS